MITAWMRMNFGGIICRKEEERWRMKQKNNFYNKIRKEAKKFRRKKLIETAEKIQKRNENYKDEIYFIRAWEEHYGKNF